MVLCYFRISKFERKDNVKGKAKVILWSGIALFSAFILWTALICSVDVRAVGPDGSEVGFSAFNVWFHSLTGVDMVLYTITDWLGLIPIIICMCFAVLGFIQMVKRRSLFKVDADILLLGGYYLLVIFGYLFFEMVPINYRPVLIDGFLEASYPSSTTLLVLSVTPTLMFRIYRRAKSGVIKISTYVFSIAFSAFMVAGRTISGVHWATDIIGSILLSFGLFMIYLYFVMIIDKRRKNDGIQ